MSQYVVYFDIGTDPEDQQGEIMLTMIFPDSAGATEFDAEAPDDSDWLIDPDGEADSETHYVDDPLGTPTLTLRPTFYDETDYQIFADGTETVSFTMPAGTKLFDHFSGVETTYVSAEGFSFKTSIDGEWTWYIDPPFPYLGFQLRIYTDASL